MLNPVCLADNVEAHRTGGDGLPVGLVNELCHGELAGAVDINEQV